MIRIRPNHQQQKQQVHCVRWLVKLFWEESTEKGKNGWNWLGKGKEDEHQNNLVNRNRFAVALRGDRFSAPDWLQDDWSRPLIDQWVICIRHVRSKSKRCGESASRRVKIGKFGNTRQNERPRNFLLRKGNVFGTVSKHRIRFRDDCSDF